MTYRYIGRLYNDRTLSHIIGWQDTQLNRLSILDSLVRRKYETQTTTGDLGHFSPGLKIRS